MRLLPIVARFRTSFLVRVLLIISICMTIPTLFIIISFYGFYYRYIFDDIIQASSKQSSLAAKYLDDIAEQTDLMARRLLRDNQGALLSYSAWPPTDSRRQGLLNDLHGYMHANVFNMYWCNKAYGKIESVYPSSDGEVSYRDVVKSEWYKNMSKHYRYQVCEFPFQSSPAMCYVATLRDSTDLSYQGFFLVKMSTSYFRNALSMLPAYCRLQYVISTSGRTLYTSHITQPRENPQLHEMVSRHIQQSGSPNGHFESGNEVFVYSACTHSDFYLVGVLPKQYIFEASITKYATVAIGLSCAAVIGMLACIWLVRRQILPIRQLSKTMRATDLEHLDPVQASGRIDEVGDLETSFNQMITHLSHMIHDQYTLQLQKRVAQIRTLQMQINPHFVNNTLQMIGTISEEHHVPMIYGIVKRFSRLFYYSLRYIDGMVSLQEEASCLSDYLYIQRQRYPDSFRYVLDFSKSALLFRVPRMTLQPLVENCFQHAYDPQDKNFSILISARVSGEECQVIVEDNGTGLSPQRLDALRMELDAPLDTSGLDDPPGIGLANVNARMRLCYGEAYHLSLESTQGTGTRVILRIPSKEVHST